MSWLDGWVLNGRWYGHRFKPW